MQVFFKETVPFLRKHPYLGTYPTKETQVAGMIVEGVRRMLSEERYVIAVDCDSDWVTV